MKITSKRHTIQFVDPRQHKQRIELVVESGSYLVQNLDEIEQRYLSALDAPIGVNLLDGCGEMLEIGLGGENWILGFCRFEDDIPVDQRYAVGDESADGSTPYYFEQLTDMPIKWLIPRQKALDGVLKWYEEGTLDEKLEWTEVCY